MIELIWKKIYNKFGYKDLSNDQKKIIDSMFNTLMYNFYYNKEKRVKSICIKEMPEVESLSRDVNLKDKGNWLIDNNLGLVFSHLYGAHKFVKADLLMFYLYERGYIKTEKDALNFTDLDTDKLSDLYTCQQIGTYLSGAGLETNGTDNKITIGSGFFLNMNNKNLSFLTSDYDLDVVQVSKGESTKELEKLVKTFD